MLENNCVKCLGTLEANLMCREKLVKERVNLKMCHIKIGIAEKNTSEKIPPIQPDLYYYLHFVMFLVY